MIENFNGIPIFGAFVLVMLGNIYYAYSTLINTKKWLDLYNTDHSALLLARILGAIIVGYIIAGFNILFTSPEGSWAYFTSLFSGFTVMAIVGFYTVEVDWKKNYEGKEGFEDVKVTKEGYIPAIIFALLNAVVLFGLSDKLYL